MLPAVPRSLKRCRTSPVVVVFPLVPVMPIEREARAGWPYQALRQRERRAPAVAHHDLGDAGLLRRLDHDGRGPARHRIGARSDGRPPGSRAPRRRACPGRTLRLSTPMPLSGPGAPPAPRPGGRLRRSSSQQLRPRSAVTALSRPTRSRRCPASPAAPAAGDVRGHPPQAPQAHPEPPPVQRQRRLPHRLARDLRHRHGCRRPWPASAVGPGDHHRGAARRRRGGRRRAIGAGPMSAVPGGSGRSPPGARRAPAAASSG